MTDLEITKLCAEAMGFESIGIEEDRHGQFVQVWYKSDWLTWQPLIDDAQAMVLVKKFHIALGWNPGWAAFRQDTKKWVYGTEVDGRDDLNRTICNCVAKMQASK